MRTSRSALWAFCFSPLLVGCSCGPEYAEVDGTVRLNGAPLAGVEVVFLPDPAKGAKGPRASAYTDGNGRYVLHTEKADRPGAVVGAHRVCIVDIAAVTTPGGLPGLSGAMPKPGGAPPKARSARVPPLYNNPASTPLHYEVAKGKQTKDFEVDGQKR